MKPTKRRDQRNAVLRARCESSLKDRVALVAQARGHDEADVVRQAVIEFLARFESQPVKEAA